MTLIDIIHLSWLVIQNTEVDIITRKQEFFYLTSWQVMTILALLSFKNEKLKLIYVYLSISYKDFTMQTVIKVSHLTDQVINFWKSSFDATWPIALISPFGLATGLSYFLFRLPFIIIPYDFFHLKVKKLIWLQR